MMSRSTDRVILYFIFTSRMNAGPVHPAYVKQFGADRSDAARGRENKGQRDEIRADFRYFDFVFGDCVGE